MRSPTTLAAQAGALAGAPVLALLVLALGGCGLFDRSETTTSTTTNTRANPTSSLSTTTTLPMPDVVEEGDTPRRALRLRFTKGATTTAELTSDLDVSQESAGTTQSLDSPVVTETVRFRVERVDGDTADISFAFTKAGLDRAGTDLTDQEYIELTADLHDLVGVGGTGRVTGRGTFTAFSYETPTGLDPRVADTLRQFEDQLPTIVVPLPTQPLGIGGRWRTTTTTTLAGITLDQITTYEITGLTDQKVAYRATTDQSAGEQDIEAPGLPAGTTVRLISSDVSGTSSGTLELDSLVSTVTSKLSGTQVIDLSDGSLPPNRLTQRLDVVLSVKTAG